MGDCLKPVETILIHFPALLFDSDFVNSKSFPSGLILAAMLHDLIRTSWHRKDRDHEGLGQGTRSPSGGLQLLRWTGLQNHGPLFLWTCASWSLGML